jgi:hypothetical protein
MPLLDQGSKLLRFSEVLYLVLIVFSFFLLVVSQTGEARTVWQVLNPAFLPTLFVATFFLLTILLFTSEKTAYKLLFLIVHSILIHSLFSIIFPAGDLSGQQIVLGQTRRVFDNTVLHGLSGWPTTSLGVLIVEMFEGINLQAALTTVIARMLSIDILYVHLFYIPVLWGVFVPLAAFLIVRAIGGGEKVSVLSSLLVSVFPYAIYFGAISVPNSLGFIFFFYSLYFMLKYLSSNDSKTKYMMVAFSLFSFLAHYLTGVVTLSLVLLAVAFKSYEREKRPLPATAKISLVLTFIVCLSLLPLSFIYLGFFGSTARPVFTLDKFSELPTGEILGLFFLGELIYGFDLKTIILIVIGPLLAFFYMLYLLYRSKKNHGALHIVGVSFLFMAFLIILIDYRILKIFMSGLPLNEERLWVFQDLIAVSFLALAIHAVVSAINAFKSKSPTSLALAGLKPSKKNSVSVSSLLLTLNVLILLLLAGWMTASLSAAYPQIAPLQTTWYELEAVKYIDENTNEKYVVIGDVWTIYAGEVIVGINNPRAYYFGEFDKTGHDLFANMSMNPSPQWLLLAMNYTDTTVAYFIVTEPRVGEEEFNSVVSLALQNAQLTVISIPGVPLEKLYVFSYKKV